MATALTAVENDMGAKLSLKKILQADNVLDLLDDVTINRIGQNVVRDFNIDETSRKDEGWEERNKIAMKAAMQVREAKDSPWPGASNIKYPLLTVSAIQFQARAYPAIVDGSNLVKGRVLGPDDGVPMMGHNGGPAMGPDGQPQFQVPPGAKRERADRVANHMTWQLLYQMAGWEEDTDRLLLILPIIGCAIRKTYYDVIQGSNVSVMIPPEDFVINYWAKSIDAAPRFTHVLRLYPYEARERIVSEIWAPVRVDSDNDDGKAQNDDENALVRFLEQHRLIDLDGDGYPEPYVVTTNMEGQVARIAACFTEKDIKTVKGEVVRIERNRYFTKYPFIPAPDGSFYDIGFGFLLGDLSATIDTVLNQLIDAGSLQNAQGGFIGNGARIKSGDMKFRLGEWKRVDVLGGTLRENIVPLNLPGPSPVLFNLLGMLIDAAKDITSVQDIMTGGPATAQTATTTMAQVEQGMKAFNAIFKRIHRAFWQELKILFRLNGEYLDEKNYFELADTPGIVMKEDYQSEDLDIMPVSDPSIATDLQKMARADYLATFEGNPRVSQEEITRRRLEAGNIQDIKKMMDVPPPPPDPQVLIEGMQKQIDKINAEANAAQKMASAALSYAGAAEKLAGMGLLPDAATLAAAAVEESNEEESGEPTGEQGRVPEMVGASGDAGLPGIPGGPGEGDAGAMGAGGAILPGAAGAGGADEPVIGPEQ